MKTAAPCVLSAPLSGRVIPLASIPDPVFSAGMVGQGLGIEPQADESGTLTALAPVSGHVEVLHPHAFALRTAQGVGVLVHLGIDTVDLAGSGFTARVKVGDEVEQGMPVIDWDMGPALAAGKSTVVPVIVTDPSGTGIRLADPVSRTGVVKAGAALGQTIPPKAQ